MRLLVAVILLVVVAPSASADRRDPAVATAPKLVGFELGEEFALECRNATTGEWSDGPVCVENGKPMAFTFGVDRFLYCGLEISDAAFYEYLVRLLSLDMTRVCRVPMSADRTFFIPLVIPFWGVVEDDHVHVDNHINWVFHTELADDGETGKILGAAAYPIRDKFQYGKIGSVINLHGPVRWFASHSFIGLSSASDDRAVVRTGTPTRTVAMLCAAVALATALLLVCFYQCRVRPRLVRRFMKRA